MLRTVLLFVLAIPLAQQSGSDGQPPKGKDAPPIVQPGGAAVLQPEFKGRAGEAILLTVNAPGPVGWFSQTPGIVFTPPALLKDTRHTAAFAPAGVYRVIVVTGEKDSQGIPVAPLATTVTVEGAK